MKKDIERRELSVAELRIAKEDDGPKIRGYAAVFNKLSEDLGGFREQIAPGAFAKALARNDVRALVNHNPDLVLGRNKSGTLRLSEDEHGLAIEIDPPDTQTARDTMTLLERGDISQMSFAFTVNKDTWQEEKGKVPIRTLEEVNLFDVSVVTYPAYPQTSAQVRSAFMEAGLDIERLAEAVTRARAGIATIEDNEAIRASVETLTAYLPVLDGRGVHDDGHVARLANGRRIAIAERIAGGN